MGRAIFFGSGQKGKENRGSKLEKVSLIYLPDTQVEMLTRQLNVRAWSSTEIQDTNIPCGFFSILMIFKAIWLNEITKEVIVKRKRSPRTKHWGFPRAGGWGEKKIQQRGNEWGRRRTRVGCSGSRSKKVSQGWGCDKLCWIELRLVSRFGKMEAIGDHDKSIFSKVEKAKAYFGWI